MKLRSIHLLICVAAFLIGAHASNAADNPEKPVWLVVTRPMFVDAIKPLADARRNDGFETVISTASFDNALGSLPRPPRYALLVGDETARDRETPWRIPSKHLDFYRWREVQRNQYASDPALADRNHDGTPDFPVGRIPARTTAQVDIAVRKILDFEKQPPTLRDLDLNVWSGSAMYGPMIDMTANGLLLELVRVKTPGWVQPWVAMGDTTQALCGWPADQPSHFLQQMHRGGLLHVFIGHGNPIAIVSMVYGNEAIYLSTQSPMDALQSSPPASPLILLTCDAGRFDGPRPSLAETLFFLPGGPVATIAATTESHPLTNSYTGTELLKELGSQRQRLGDFWLDVQKRARTAPGIVMEWLLRDVEGKLEDEINVARLRHDQMLIYNLLGDPATKLRLPERLMISVSRKGGHWHWRAEHPKGATRLEVSVRPSPIELPAPTTQSADRESANAAMDATNARFEFKTTATLDGNQPWEGDITERCTIRFVAMSGNRIFVASFDTAQEPFEPTPATQN